VPDQDAADCGVDKRKPRAAPRSRKSGGQPRRSRGSSTLAEMLRRALDAPAEAMGDGTEHSFTKRELMIRGLVERSTEGDLAATRLLFEMLRKADPRGVAAPDDATPVGQDALALLKERLARLADAQAASDPSRGNPGAAGETSPTDETPGP
jgi:hypothetical protein